MAKINIGDRVEFTYDDIIADDLGALWQLKGLIGTVVEIKPYNLWNVPFDMFCIRFDSLPKKDPVECLEEYLKLINTNPNAPTGVLPGASGSMQQPGTPGMSQPGVGGLSQFIGSGWNDDGRIENVFNKESIAEQLQPIKCDCGGFKTYNSMEPENHSNWCSSRQVRPTINIGSALKMFDNFKTGWNGASLVKRKGYTKIGKP